MEYLNRLNKESRLIISGAKSLADFYKEDCVDSRHLLLSATVTSSAFSNLLLEYGMDFNFLMGLFFEELIDKDSFLIYLKNNKPKENFKLPLSIVAFKAIQVALIKKNESDGWVSPADIMLELVEAKDSTVWLLLQYMGARAEEFLKELSILVLSYKGSDIVSSKEMKHISKKQSKKNSVIESYARNLVEEAKKGELDPVLGRDSEIDRVIEILGRKKKSNPCLIGDAGVGKTAIVEGLAIKIANNGVPDFLKNVDIYSVDIPSLLAGTKYRGDFEERITTLINEVITKNNIILFFDEIHNLIGTGSGEDSINVGNVLKPYLARGSICCIGATTTKEYASFIEKDSALERRFQKVKISEPSVEDCIKILIDCKAAYEKYHGVIISDDVIKYAVELTDRYVKDRKLPDKAFDLIDEACSRAKIGSAKKVLQQKDLSLILYKWTGIPSSELSLDKSKNALNLRANLRKQIVGQDEAIDTVSMAIMRSQAGLRDDEKPIASFVFTGPTGVGKTEFARSLSFNMFGSYKKLIRIDMSEYMEKSSVSKLIGSAPGYVGYKDAGQLTEAIRQNPYSVVLFDEVEKAHPEVINIFLQLLDSGRLTDGQGKTVDFKNTILIFTSNLYNPLSTKKAIGFPAKNDKLTEDNKNNAIKSFSSFFSPEFVNRFDDIIVFNPLSEGDLYKILDISLKGLKKKLKKRNIKLVLTKKSKGFLISQIKSTEFGARELKRIITKYIENEISFIILNNKNLKNSTIKVTCVSSKLKFDLIENNIVEIQESENKEVDVLLV